MHKLKTLSRTAVVSASVTYILLLTDNIIIGHFLGESAIGSIGLISPLYLLVVYFSTIIADGVRSCMFNEASRFHKNRRNSFFTMGIVLSAGVGIVMLICIILIKPFYFSVLNVTSLEYIYASNYYDVFKFVLLIYPLQSCLLKIVYSSGDIKTFLFAAFIQVSLNIPLSIYLCQMIGIRGVAWGTFCGTAISAIILAMHFSNNNKSDIRFNSHLSQNKLKRIIKNSSLSSSILFLQSIFTFLLNHFVLLNFGKSYLPALTIALQAFNITTIFASLSWGMIAMLLLYDGEKNKRKIEEVMLFIRRYSTVITIIGTALMFILAKEFVSLYGLVSNDSISLAIIATRIVCFTYLAEAFCEYIISYHMELGNKKFASVIALLDEVVMEFVFIIPLSMLFGFAGIWIGMVMESFITLGLTLVFYKIRYAINTSKMDSDDELTTNIYSFDLTTDIDSIISTRDKVQQVIESHSSDSSLVLKIGILVEEVFMLIREKNNSSSIICELTIQFSDDSIFIIFKDSGVIFRLADENFELNSFRSFVLSSMIEHTNDKISMVAINCNRTGFLYSLSNHSK